MVRQTLREQLESLVLHQESRVAIYGSGEFAELVYLGLRELGIEEIEVFGPNGSAGQRFLGIPVRDISTLQSTEYDRVMIALLGGLERISSDLLSKGVDPEKLVAFFADGRTRVGV
jgi:hypothetical protein